MQVMDKVIRNVARCTATSQDKEEYRDPAVRERTHDCKEKIMHQSSSMPSSPSISFSSAPPASSPSAPNAPFSPANASSKS
jgi:hypothetical protein